MPGPELLAGNGAGLGRNGAIAQLGERLHGMQEVSGSIPLGSTNILLGVLIFHWQPLSLEAD